MQRIARGDFVEPSLTAEMNREQARLCSALHITRPKTKAKVGDGTKRQL